MRLFPNATPNARLRSVGVLPGRHERSSGCPASADAAREPATSVFTIIFHRLRRAGPQLPQSASMEKRRIRAVRPLVLRDEYAITSS